jgi:methylated-DNA-[protein]-cysteine S-methyltransferase
MFVDLPLSAAERFNLSLETPVGWLSIEANDTAVTRLTWRRRPDRPSPLVKDAAAQLAAYFAGTLKAFDLPLAPGGSDHERRVWIELCRIPYGETITYGEMARRACGTNPVAIIIPCHRVTAAGGALGGYSGGSGAASKRKLLAHEARHAGIFALTA